MRSARSVDRFCRTIRISLNHRVIRHAPKCEHSCATDYCSRPEGTIWTPSIITSCNITSAGKLGRKSPRQTMRSRICGEWVYAWDSKLESNWIGLNNKKQATLFLYMHHTVLSLMASSWLSSAILSMSDVSPHHDDYALHHHDDCTSPHHYGWCLVLTSPSPLPYTSVLLSGSSTWT